MMEIFIVWIVFICSEQKINWNQKKVCESKEFCRVGMLSKDTEILGFNQYWKFDKTPLLFMEILNL